MRSKEQLADWNLLQQAVSLGRPDLRHLSDEACLERSFTFFSTLAGFELGARRAIFTLATRSWARRDERSGEIHSRPTGFHPGC